VKDVPGRKNDHVSFHFFLLKKDFSKLLNELGHTILWSSCNFFMCKIFINWTIFYKIVSHFSSQVIILYGQGQTRMITLRLCFSLLGNFSLVKGQFVSYSCLYSRKVKILWAICFSAVCFKFLVCFLELVSNHSDNLIDNLIPHGSIFFA